jgi:hypothetical protein
MRDTKKTCRQRRGLRTWERFELNGGRMGYTVLVHDNFHYQDEDERCELGRFETGAEAVAACQRVDENLLWLHAQRPGSSPAELYEYYRSFGDDPFIVAEGERAEFSAWNYAKERSEVVDRFEARLRNPRALRPFVRLDPGQSVSPASVSSAS